MSWHTLQSSAMLGSLRGVCGILFITGCCSEADHELTPHSSKDHDTIQCASCCQGWPGYMSCTPLVARPALQIIEEMMCNKAIQERPRPVNSRWTSGLLGRQSNIARGCICSDVLHRKRSDKQKDRKMISASS